MAFLVQVQTLTGTQDPSRWLSTQHTWAQSPPSLCPCPGPSRVGEWQKSLGWSREQSAENSLQGEGVGGRGPYMSWDSRSQLSHGTSNTKHYSKDKMFQHVEIVTTNIKVQALLTACASLALCDCTVHTAKEYTTLSTLIRGQPCTCDQGFLISVILAFWTRDFFFWGGGRLGSAVLCNVGLLVASFVFAH